MRRVASIAIVHETLSMSVDEEVEFDGIVDRVAAAAVEVAAPGDARCTLRRASSFGVLPAEVATPLAMVLNELLLNAVEHGFAGREDERRPPARWSSRRTGSAGSCTSAWPTTAGACPTTSTSTRPTGWGCRSCGRWPGASCAARSRCVPGPAAAPRPSSSSR